ncbi:hypothetical protein [Liquorilactobacillus satsumensis]|uniref:hypothetical protein n=1 Tax=Liquorilactobacillus satsumensis TaxID=259059 RepID=UPI00345D2B14
MDVKKMLDSARLQTELLVENTPISKRPAALFCELNLDLAVLFNAYFEQKPAAFLPDFCKVTALFLRIANEKKWTYLLLLPDEKLTYLEQKPVSRFVADDYLIMQKLLNNSYFKRRSAAFVHAWHIFVKFGLVDLGFSAAEIQTAFLEIFPPASGEQF